MAAKKKKKGKYRHWRLETDADGIAWLAADKADAGTNVLSEPVLAELDAITGELPADTTGLVIFSAKDNGFFAGADISEFTTLGDQAHALELISRGQSVFDRIEALGFPTVAMVHGFCVGGGLELALACRYRVLREGTDTRVGLPEVKLGIHPGFGGSVRLTRLIGAPAAMDLMLTGRTVDARRAGKLGIADRVAPERHLRTAARQLVMQGPAPHRPGRLAALASLGPLRPLLGKWMRRQVASRADPEHYPAPYALIDLWQRHADDPRAMLDAEAKSVADLITGATAQNLIRVFFLQEQLKGLGRAEDFEPRHVHVVGAGAMGGDIAAWCAVQGLTVSLQDRGAEFIAPAIARAHKLFEYRLKERRAVQAAMDRLIPDVRGDAVRHADVVIEAIIENIEIKQALFRDIEPRLKPGAILATNTSSIPLETLGEALQDPGRLIGLHFFNPVARMQLVEVVSGEATDPVQAAKGAALVKRIQRLPLPVASSPGFLVNRILMPYLMEAVELVSEGVPVTAVDEAATRFGMPMGPIELADTVGLDICLSVGDILAGSLGIEVPQRLRDMVGAGHLGRKSGQGFYRFDKGKKVAPAADDSRPAPADITDRLVLRMINEAVACLREGVVDGADLLDAGMIFGTGFAPFRGGPMHYVEQRGADAVEQRLHYLQSQYGERFAADEGWEAPTG